MIAFVTHENFMNEKQLSYLLQGAAAGIVGTAAMSAAMMLFKKSGALKTEVMPKRITGNLVCKAGLRNKLPPPTFECAWIASHFAYGATWSALVNVFAAKKIRAQPYVSGTALGGALWALSYLGWVPLVGLYPPVNKEPSHRQQPGTRVAAEIALHLVYGLATAFSLKSFARDVNPSSSCSVKFEARQKRSSTESPTEMIVK